MNIVVLTIAKFFSGIIAIASGIFTLVFNNVSYCFYNSMTDYQKIICVIIVIGIGIFLIVVSVIDFISSIKNQLHEHKLKYQSKKYFKFFTKWYKKAGTLSIICDSLDWIKSDNNKDIYFALLDKSKQKELHLYLGKGYNSDLAIEFKKEGAAVSKAPEKIISSYTWSCLSIMGNSASKIIVRNKQKDKGDYIVVDEICNTYVTELLNELLDWREQACNSNQNTI